MQGLTILGVPAEATSLRGTACASGISAVTFTVRIAIIGVKKRYQRLGIDLMLYVESWKRATTLRMVRGEAGRILDDSHLMLRALEELGAVAYKRFQLYRKDRV